MSTVLELAPLDRLLASLDRQGRGFELLCRWFLQNDPEFRAEYKQVWLWRDWPGRWGPDRGIDLVAITFTDRTDAIQAKHYGPEHTVTKRDIDTFLSESNRRGIDARLLIASTDRLAGSAREVMAEQEKPVSTCLLARMRASAVEWPASIVELAPANPAAAEPREHQLQALEEIERWAAGGGVRGQVIMACGTGKSLIEVWAAERLGAQQVLVLVPTIPLVRQCAREWPRHATTQRGLLRICSDKAAPDTEDIIRGDELGTARTTTDPAGIAERLRDGSPLLIEVAYRASTGEAGYATEAKVQESVQAGIQLDVSPSRTGPEGTITLSGKVAGPIPPQGAIIDLLVHYRGRWEPFRTPRTNRHGRFRVLYQFEGGVGRFPFRAEVPGGQAGFPFGNGESRVVNVSTN